MEEAYNRPEPGVVSLDYEVCVCIASKNLYLGDI